MADKKSKVTHNTTRLVSDRLAKLASTYTNGYAKVHYVADRVCTDVKGNIYLPAYLRDVKPELEANAFAYTLHESGHQGVENDLKIARKQRKKIACSDALFQMVPDELKSIAMQPKGKLVLTGEWLKNCEKYGHAIAAAYDGHPYAAASQLRTLANVFEDPRMENQVGRRWAGAKSYLAHGNEKAHSNWREKATELIAQGRDRSFDVFSIGLLFAVAGEDYSFLGPIVGAQVSACEDIIELFKNDANWETSMGFYDAVNAALCCLSRVYRKEEASEAPAPACPACGSENVKGTFRRPNIATMICLDCGHREEMQVEEGEGAGEAADGPGLEMEEETDMFDKPEGDDASDAEGDAGDDAGEGEGEAQDGGENGDKGESSDGNAEGEAEGEASSDDSDDASSNKGLSVGMVIRVKADGTRARITAINPDGTVQAELVA